MHRILLLLLFLCAANSFSQTITLKGKITDSQDFPLEAATIYLTRVKDSSIIDYTISGKGGLWEIKVKKLSSLVFLKVSYVGLANYKQEYPALEQDRDFGTLKLADQSIELNEVVIQGEIPPIRIKKDTLEFNAVSFKVRPDANVETLLKQLPGLDIDADGKITLNGKEVNQILVNGKPFFDTNGQIAIKNLPAEIIDKVQVSDTKTKKEELAGQKAAGDNSSINLTIKKDKNKGFFGKAMGGYGSDERYESSLIMNYFQEKLKLSLLAASNNINSSGFTFNEIFDSMGSGRNAPGFLNAGNGRGITKTDLVGINYTDEWFKDFDAGISYNYTGTNTENNNRTSSTNYLPVSKDDDNPDTEIDKSYTTQSVSRTDNERYSNIVNTDFKFEIDSTSTLHFGPRLSTANSKSRSNSSRFSDRIADGKRMNESTALSNSETDSNSFSNQFTYNKQLRSRKGRGISAFFSNANTKNDDKTLNQSNTTKYKYPGDEIIAETDNRDQILNTNSYSDVYNLNLEYTEPVTDSLALSISAGYDFSRSVDNRDTYDYDPETGNYTTYNNALSNYLTSQTGTFSPRAGVRFDLGKLYVDAGAGSDVTSFKNFASYLGQDYSLNQNYILPSADMNMRYTLAKSKSVSFNYNYVVGFPQASQILPVADISNPLNTTIGNPDINPNKSHRLRAGFRNFNTAAKSGLNFWLSSTFFDSQITQFTITDNSGKNTTTYRNVSGAMNSSFSVNWNKTIKKDAHTYRFSINGSTSYNIDKGFLNGELYDSKSVRFSPNVNFTYEYGELLTINPSYSYTYNEYRYTNYSINASSNFVHRLNLQTTSYWPKHVVFGNDFGYTYNSNIADGYKKDFYLWNTSVGYNFLNDDLLFKVKVYDVLNQNLATSRTIGPTSIVDQENTVLKRYIMFSLTYKLEKFGGVKGNNNNSNRPQRRFDMTRPN
jgi:hypothetical protein